MEDEVYFELKIFLNFTLDLRLEVDRSDVAQERQLWFRIMSDVCERCGHAGKPPPAAAASPVPEDHKRHKEVHKKHNKHIRKQSSLVPYSMLLVLFVDFFVPFVILEILEDVVEHHLPHVLQQQRIRHAMP